MAHFGDVMRTETDTFQVGETLPNDLKHFCVGHHTANVPLVAVERHIFDEADIQRLERLKFHKTKAMQE